MIKDIIIQAIIMTVVLILTYVVSYAIGYSDSIWYLYGAFMAGMFTRLLLNLTFTHDEN